MNIAIILIQIVAPRKHQGYSGRRRMNCSTASLGKDTYFDAYGKTGVLSFVPDEKQNALQRSHIIHWKWNQMGQYARNGHILTGRTRILRRPRNFYCDGRNSLSRKLNKEDKMLSTKKP